MMQETRMKMSLTILLILFGLLAYAQKGVTLSGTVKNSEVKPIEGITMSLFLKGDSTAIKTTQTNRDGLIKFKIHQKECGCRQIQDK